MSSRNPILVRRRRNGKPQSCEPCRKSKVRCDHKTPVCQRCIVRGVERECIYHPAPLTRIPDSPRSPTVHTHTGFPVLRPTRLAATRNDTGQTSRQTGLSLPAPRSNPPTKTGFLGPTSFSAIIDDDRDIVDRHTMQIPSHEIAHEAEMDLKQISEESIMAGIAVLKLITDLPNLEESIQRYLDLSYTCMVPNSLVRACVLSIQEAFRGTSKLKKEQLKKCVTTLFENTHKPLSLFTSVGAKDYHTLFTGPNLRWEIVGFVLAMFGVSLKYDMNRPFHEPVEDYKLISRIVEAVDYCIAVCHTCDAVNHQTLWLHYAVTSLKSLVYGDTSFQNWRSVGEATSLFFALGLHDNSKHEATQPFYQCELRRVYAARVFSSDKTTSTLLGRPPRISGRYCAFTPPADIDDSVLFLDDERLRESILNVDQNGWNLDGNFRSATWRRVKLLVAQFREEVLEVCLGKPRDNSDSQAQAQSILNRHEMVWDQIPMHLKYDEHSRCEHIPPPQRYVMMTTYMDQNYNRFLLHRKLVKDTQYSREPLYKISRSLLATVLQVISLSDSFPNMQRDISWFTLYYGLPGASILAVDLLKQLILAHNTSDEQLDMVPRSEVIQNLSIFISNLQRAVNRGDVDQAACVWARQVLSCILDEIIDPKHRKNSTQQAQDALVANIPLPTDTGLDGNLSVDDFLSWVEEADWNLDTSAFVI